MAIARYLADKSAIARLHHPLVRAQLVPLIEAGLIASCTLVDLEVLFSTRTADDYATVSRERRGFERLDIDQVDWDRAAAVQAELAACGRTRAVGIPDLLLSAVAERHRVTLLHYDRDFESVADITGQETVWIVPAGSVP
ncbi:MAG: PIN domain nuclease [Mycobacteriales bacterium]